MEVVVDVTIVEIVAVELPVVKVVMVEAVVKFIEKLWCKSW